MDWGLLRTTESGKFLLRKKILYPANFYYFAAITNFLMRITWVLNIYTHLYEAPIWYIQSQFAIFFIATVEAFRRFQWALIRIENENVNNFERYRNILMIPEFDEDYMAAKKKKSR